MGRDVDSGTYVDRGVVPSPAMPRFGYSPARCIVGMAAVAISACGCEERDRQLDEVEIDAARASATTTPPATAARREPGTFEFTHDLAAATERARREQRPMLIYFHAQWSVACKELEKQVFADARFREAASRYVGVMVDLTDDEAPEVIRLKDEHKLLGFPAVILLDARGEETMRTYEFAPLERWLDRLHTIERSR